MKVKSVAIAMLIWVGILFSMSALAHNQSISAVVLVPAGWNMQGSDCPGGAPCAQIGTWKLNEAKSKFGPGASKNTTVVYEAAGDNVRVTVEGTDSDGKPTHNEWTGKFDGNDYPVTGDPNSDARSYKKVNDRTLTFTAKKNGKVTITGRVVLSADGKSRTATASGTDPKGNKVSWTAVYDKQ